MYVRELVHGNDDLEPELLRVLDVLHEVLAALLKGDEILLGVRVMQGLAGRDVWASAVHLEGARGGDDDDGIGGETAHAALDVAEFLHAHVGAEATFGEHVSGTGRVIALLCARELKCDAVSKDRRVPVSDVGEGTGVDEDGSTLVPRS